MQKRQSSSRVKKTGIRSRADNENSPLRTAIMHGDNEEVKRLLENDSDPVFLAKNGDALLDLATQLGLGGYREPGAINPYPEIVKMLQYAISKRRPGETQPDNLNQEVASLIDKFGFLGINSAPGNNDAADIEKSDNSASPSSPQMCILL